MIHGSSHDPVLIKKIRLRVWTLRSEIEAIVAQRLAATGNQADQLVIGDLIDEYKKSNGQEAKVISATDAASTPNLDAETEVNESEEPTAETEEETESSEESVEMAAADETDDALEASAESNAAGAEANDDNNEDVDQSNVIEIKQRRPQIPAEQLSTGTTLLSEVYMNNMYFFCSERFLEGQSIVIEFLVPKRFIINADVVYCRPYSMKSRIISENKLPYRCCVDFTFLKQGEKTLLRQFIQSVEPDVQSHHAAAQAAKPQQKESDDDFDLDDLDL